VVCPAPDIRSPIGRFYYALPDDAGHKETTCSHRFVAAKASDTLYANIEHGAPIVHDLLFSAATLPLPANR